MALAFACLSNGGMRAAPRIALAVETPAQGWVILPASESPLRVLEGADASREAEFLRAPDQPFWQFGARPRVGEKSFTWFAGGTLPGWQGAPLTVIVLLEEDNAPLANEIGGRLLTLALSP
jgi:hypothetical protein